MKTIPQFSPLPLSLRGISIVAIGALAALLSPLAHAASATWNAAPTDGNWEVTTTENNWSTDTATPGLLPGNNACRWRNLRGYER